MTTLPSMGLTLPTRGAAGSGHWADVLDADLTLVDGHSHRPGSGVRIVSDAININADITFNTSWAITALNRVTFASVAPPAVNKSCFVGDGTGGTTANELYWTTAAGANVKLTAGNSLNVASFVGGIVDDYSSVGAQLGYDDGAKRYTFKEGTGDSNHWARVYCGGVRIAEFGTNEALYVEQLAPAALAATYAMTWPTALPGSTALAQIDSTGQISFTNTIASTLPHGNVTLVLAAAIGLASTGTYVINTDGSIQSSSAGTWVIPVPLLTGDRVQSVVLAGFGDGAVDVTVNVNYIGKTGGSSTKATTTITNAPAGWNDSTATAGAPAALAAGEVCIVTVAPNATLFAFNNVRVVYDRP